MRSIVTCFRLAHANLAERVMMNDGCQQFQPCLFALSTLPIPTQTGVIFDRQLVTLSHYFGLILPNSINHMKYCIDYYHYFFVHIVSSVLSNAWNVAQVKICDRSSFSQIASGVMYSSYYHFGNRMLFWQLSANYDAQIGTNSKWTVNVTKQCL